MNPKKENNNQKTYGNQGTLVPFFKQGNLFEKLKNDLLPDLFSQKPGNIPLKFWVPGCTTGEEVYTFSIICGDLKKMLKSRKSFRIIGTDVNPKYIEYARQGVYLKKNLRNLSEQDRNRHFEDLDHCRLKVKPPVRKSCFFGQLDILREMPPTDNTLIDLSNLRLEYHRETQSFFLNRLFDRIAPGGLLIIRGWEILNFAKSSFIDCKSVKPYFIYKKSLTAKTGLLHSHPSSYTFNADNQEHEIVGAEIKPNPMKQLILDTKGLSASQEELIILNEQMKTAQEEAELKSREHLHLKDEMGNLLDTIDTSVILLDKSLRILRFNKMSQNLFHTIPTDIGRKITDLKPDLIIRDFDKLLKRSFRQKKDLELDVNNDRGITYLLKIKYLTNEDPGSARLIITCIDINTLKKAQEKLRFDSLLLSSLNDAVIALDKNERIIYFNHEAEKQYEISANEALGEKQSDIYTNKFLSDKDEKKHHDDLMKKGYWRGENIHITKSGRRIYVETTVNAIKDNKGKQTGLQVLLHDISSRKGMELRLKEKSDRLNTAMKSGHMFAFEWFPKTYEVNLSEHSAKILGIKKNVVKFPAKRFFKRIHPQDRNNFIKIIKHLTPAQNTYSTSYRIRRDDTGEYIVLGNKAQAYFDTNGNLSRLCGIAADITERKRAEQVLKRDKQTLEKIVKERTKKLIEKEIELERQKRLSDIGVLAATVAHELRNPLAAIRMACYNIEKKSKDTNISPNLECITEKIVDSETIISNLLFYSRLKPPEFQTIRIFDVLKECVDNAQIIAKEKNSVDLTGINFLVNEMIAADSFQMKELFTNILNNAYDAIDDDHGLIKVMSQKKNGALAISFSDNGKGIEKNDLEHICDPFFTTKSKGTGLGLSVCQQIAKFHNGSIDVKSRKGKGTTITVTLPITQ